MSAAVELDRDTDSSGVTSQSETSSSPSDTATGLLGGAAQKKSGARSAQLPSEDQLLDVLYEVLAQGVLPRSTLKQEEVERFLHEHARETKPVSEMLAFFELHGLPTDASAYGADPELGELASGLQKERSLLAPGFGPAEPLHEAAVQLAPPPIAAPGSLPPATHPAVVAAAAAAPLENERTGRRGAPSAPTKLSSRAQPGAARKRWLALLAAALVLGGLVAFALDYQQRALALEQRLDQARMQQRSTDQALTKLEQRAETLQGELKQSEQERQAQSWRLQNSLEEQARRRATEEQAIERVLGPRYLKLRQKYTAEAAAPVVEPVHP